MADGDGMTSHENALSEAQRARDAGDLGRAFQLLQGALDQAELERAEPSALAPLQLELGEIAAAFGDTTEAREWLEAAEASFDSDAMGAAAAHLALGRLDARSGVVGEARRRFRMALKAYESVPRSIEAALCHLELADLYVDSGDAAVAQLELGAAQPLRESDRPDHQVDLLLVVARAAASRGDAPKAAAALEDARRVAEKFPARTANVEAIIDSWNQDRSTTPHRFASDGLAEGWSLRFVTIVVGSDGMIGEAAIVDTGDMDVNNLRAARRFVNNVGSERRGIPVATEPRVRVALHTDLEVFGLAYAFYEVLSIPCGFSIIASGAEADEARLAKSDAAVSYYAGRWATDSYVGFSRHRAFRPGAVTAVKERPVTFFVAYGDVPSDVARTCHERHLELSAAFIAMIQEDGDPARRLRRLTNEHRQ